MNHEQEFQTANQDQQRVCVMSVQPDECSVANQYFEELQASGARVFIPEVAGIEWSRILADPSIPLVITNRPSQALELCRMGQPAVAIMAASKVAVMKWLRDRGANIVRRS
jgi:hypothetical protein